MEKKRTKKLIGLAMVGLGLVQAVSFTLQSEWIPMILGLIYSIIGIAYLRVEVYTAGG
jgi:1,4-dihydroxy-2-naphthoate octaprenyltransferase